MQNLNYETLTFFSRLPSQLPPQEHYKGRHSLDVDLLTPGLKTGHYDRFSHSIG